MNIQTKSTSRSKLRPKIVISEKDLDRLEALAEGAAKRNPQLSDRLLEELARARIMPAAKFPAHVVTIGNRVTYRDELTREEKTISLSFPEDADIGAGRVSVMTPLGVALIGLSEGAAFHWETRDGHRRTLTVLKVTSSEPEKA
ncbi:nucleoside diphosphate kinase regulator [Rhodovulum visakhapatnamense]|uniref:GreA/GreB family elongation factor n=3 Tax=Rhodovulum TaxID=34008 RepID=A0A4R2PU88_9RHOB|nr:MULTISPECIES: nucleoside diphosphate kinase regulator [Rhodovulum]TCP38618.1 GreA/GreB family elongation factor [Rhodovulum marinum]TDX24719.1 regulator of nucleoside diphosphate kinase [Rhodovulum visakhapatnamense]